jgi:hypothetical protein
VIVFLDYQNVYAGAREAFHAPADQSTFGQVDPVALARVITAAKPGRALKQVRVYRGLPSNRLNPKGYGAVRRQTAAWKAANKDLVDVFLRPLQGDPPHEKGIDVQLAVDFVLLAVRGEYDVGVLFSTDTDMKPALDAVFELNGKERPWPEVAAWSGPNHYRRRITASQRSHSVPCNWVDDIKYARIQDLTRYAI